MTHSLKPSLPPNVQGILWMTLSMAAFALEDLFVKRAVQALPLSEVLVLCGLGGALVFAVLAWGQGVRLLQPAARSRLMAGRALFELVGRLFYALAIALTPLSTTTAILQATPVLALLAGAVGVGTLAYAALMKAMRTGDLATVTPFRYTRLLFGLTVGALVFGERVDAAMVAGCLVIVAAGLLIAWDNALARRRLIPI